MPTLHLHEALSTWQQPRPANDNDLVTADSFADLAARRAYVQRAQTRPEPVLALPTLERLGRTAPDVVPLWRYWRDLQSAPEGAAALPEYAKSWHVSGALRPGLDEEGDEPANIGFSLVELDLEIRPRVEELQRAWESAPARRVSVHCTVSGGKRYDVQPVIDPVVTVKGDTAYIGPLVFRNGALVRWGTFGRGKPLRPIERPGEPKGSRQAPPERDLRWLVRTDAPIAKGAAFLAGKTATTGRSGAPAECFAEAEQSKKAEDGNLRATLGAHAEILDLAIGDSAAKQIGESRGFHGKHAERRGIFLVNEAFAALRALVGENILPKAA